MVVTTKRPLSIVVGLDFRFPDRPETANGRFVAVISEPPVPGFGRLSPERLVSQVRMRYLFKADDTCGTKPCVTNFKSVG
jgi:hypothetical protein